MAGDHKCPVCQATFTRPQHVARHMRSHTGDRPYKCQHCGDQFARSDLLSRHINKCHANEKPPVTTAPNQRRKGAAAACRATTSKQACDQCVQSTLPCDGANPCSKCVQRKCRCTYVKFHRQTAPAGPGHQPPPRAASELDSPLPPYGAGARYAQSAEYQLPLAGADPSSLALGGNLSSLYGPAQHPYAFNPALSGYAHHEASGTLGPTASTSTDDFAARYRQHAEMLRRAGVLPPASVSVAPDVNSLSAGLLYNDALQQGRYGQQEPQVSGWDRQQQHPQTHQDQNSYHNAEKQIDSYDQFGYVDPTGRQQMLQRQQQPQPQQYSYYTHARHSSVPDARRNSVDLGSESSVTGSISSAASSNVHLPFDARSNYSSTSTRPSTAESPASATRSLPPSNQLTHGHARSESEGGHDDFRSAFGLMSLDDPNVLAGIANDAQPFFSGMGLPTPTPAKERDARARALDSLFPARSDDRRDGLGSLPSSGLTPRELETRELRDFWKQYMRTPLTGGGPLGATPGLSSLTGILGEPSSARPGPPKRGLSRVASLPSVKTPGVSIRDGYDYGAQGQGIMPAPPAPAQAGRTYTGANDDLKSYEAAVLSRRAPMNLSLQPRRGRAGSAVGIQNLTGGSPVYGNMQRDSNASASASPELQHRTANTENVRAASASYGHTRAGSALDNVDSRPSTGYMRPPSGVPDVTFRHASVLTDDGSGGSTSDNDANAARPSFKRLASQTLGPDNAKRAALAGALGDEEDDKYASQSTYGSPERPVMALPDQRYRRLSAPTAPSGIIGGYA